MGINRRRGEREFRAQEIATVFKDEIAQRLGCGRMAFVCQMRNMPCAHQRGALYLEDRQCAMAQLQGECMQRDQRHAHAGYHGLLDHFVAVHFDQAFGPEQGLLEVFVAERAGA